MSDDDKKLLEAALDAAVAKHFSTLFEVLMVASERDDKAMSRFQLGLEKLLARRVEVLASLSQP